VACKRGLGSGPLSFFTALSGFFSAPKDQNPKENRLQLSIKPHNIINRVKQFSFGLRF
jgi:hypothetical protein